MLMGVLFGGQYIFRTSSSCLANLRGNRQFAKELIATCVTSCNQENGSHKTSECSEMEHSAQHTELQGIEHKGSQLRRQLADKGYLGITVPEEFGGQTGSILDVVLFVEAVSEYEPGLALSLSNHYGY